MSRDTGLFLCRIKFCLTLKLYERRNMNFGEFENMLHRLAEQGRLPESGTETLQKFQKMEGIYKAWNEKINVISRKDIENGLYEHHILHSLALAAYLHERGRSLDGTVLDLGTGGGFPGIPLAAICPQAHFVLCDSIGKKTKVAKRVAEELWLPNVEVVNARAESLGRQFDTVVSRAVSSLVDFYPWVRGYYKKSILYLKGGDVALETGELMSRFRLPKGSVKVSPIKFDGEWFAQKYVVEIE